MPQTTSRTPSSLRSSEATFREPPTGASPQSVCSLRPSGICRRTSATLVPSSVDEKPLRASSRSGRPSLSRSAIAVPQPEFTEEELLWGSFSTTDLAIRPHDAEVDAEVARLRLQHDEVDATQDLSEIFGMANEDLEAAGLADLVLDG